MSILNELYSKCLNQETEINKEIKNLINNQYPHYAINRMKDKIKERLENFYSSINLLSKSLYNSKISNDDKLLWNKKIENLILTYKNLNKRLDDCVYNLNKKYKDLNNLGNSYFSNEFSQNINNLQQENRGWKNVLKLSNEIENHSSILNAELDNQNNVIGKINNKVSNMVDKLVNSNALTNWLIKRGRGDTFICFFMGFLTIGILYFTYYYIKPRIKGY
jgi:paraquat-inducible protein B